jgi:glycosyltransferase involved in cell wall biosynthesis
MKKMLMMTPNAFHSKSGNAGSKVLQHYFTHFNNDKQFVTAIAYTGNKDSDYDKMQHEFKNVHIFSNHLRKNILQKSIDYFRFNILYPKLKAVWPIYYATNGFIKNKIHKVLAYAKASSFYPDIIIVEFTILILWVDLIRKIFPKSLLVASCHDVTFLSVERFLNLNNRNSIWWKYYYKTFKKIEVDKLNRFDLLVFLNSKDQALIEREKGYEGIPTLVITPFFDTYQIANKKNRDKIVFFGAMSREENCQAVEWFLNNVWIELDRKLGGKIKFYIVGSGMQEKNMEAFKKFNNVVITGFIEDPTEIFSEALCFVAPLSLGAGIKIKVLEAMSSGIPILTNNVGIEGIPAKRNIDYLHCNNEIDYIEGVLRLFEDKEFQMQMSKNSKELIVKNFNTTESYKKYSSLLISLHNNRIGKS